MFQNLEKLLKGVLNIKSSINIINYLIHPGSNSKTSILWKENLFVNPWNSFKMPKMEDV
jgi:hypothetical protein